METSILIPFFTYAIITSFTPGPNNILALSSTSQYGIRRSVGVLSGMCAGFFAVMLLCAAFTLSLTRMVPDMAQWLSGVGALYILWLAWRIAVSDPTASGAAARPLGFWAGFVLQFVNVKIILYGITAISSFLLPYMRDMWGMLGVSVLLAGFGWVGNSLWAMGGHLFQKAFKKHGRAINRILAVMLVYCALRLFV